MRSITFFLILSISLVAFGETFNYGDGITVTVTPSNYKLVLSQKSRNGGTAQGSFSGPMKDGKRNGTWSANITYQNYIPDNEGYTKTGTITMLRNYRVGVLHGSYVYNQKLSFRDCVHTSSGWVLSAKATTDNLSVKGAFDDGLLDGDWVCKGDEMLLPSYTARFKKGVPEYEKNKINGKVDETIYTDSLITKDLTIFSNGTIEGWQVSLDAVMNTMKGEKVENKYGLTKNDDNPLYGFQYEFNLSEFIVPRRMAEWLLYMPSNSSAETAKKVFYKFDNNHFENISYIGDDDFRARMENETKRKKESARKDSLQKINDTFVAELKDAKREILNSIKMSDEVEYFFKRTKINLIAPKLKESWDNYLLKRSDIQDFIAANGSVGLTDHVKYNVIRLSDEFWFDPSTIERANMIFKLAEEEAQKWGVEDKNLIRKKVLTYCPNLPFADVTFKITADRTGKSHELSITCPSIDNSNGYSNYDLEMKGKRKWYEWLWDNYKKQYNYKVELSEITEEDLFLWAVADNMKFESHGNYKMIDGKVKKTDILLATVNQIRYMIPPSIDWNDITIDRITYEHIQQSGGVSYDKKLTKTVNVGEVYEKAKMREDWIKLKDSFGKIVEKSKKK